MPYIINEDQTGYVKGCFIGCNIRQMEDALFFCNVYNTPGINLTIYFEKHLILSVASLLTKSLNPLV